MVCFSEKPAIIGSNWRTKGASERNGFLKTCRGLSLSLSGFSSIVSATKMTMKNNAILALCSARVSSSSQAKNSKALDEQIQLCKDYTVNSLGYS